MAKLIVMHFYATLDASQALIEHLKDEYHQYMLQAAIFHEALSCLSFTGIYMLIFSQFDVIF